MKTFLDFFIAFAGGFGLRLCQLLPKIHEQELEILDGVKPVLIPSSPLVCGLFAELAGLEIVLRRSWDFLGYELPRFAGHETWVIAVRCTYLERL